MALKRQFGMEASFSMASMTDVIFLLLIFFMVTSTFVFPNALEVNLPESAAQTTLKPTARIYIDAEGKTATMYGEGADWQLIDSEEQLVAFLKLLLQQEVEANPAEGAEPTSTFVALYADKEVPYGRVVEILNLGAENSVRVVLATAAPDKSPIPAAAADEQ